VYKQKRQIVIQIEKARKSWNSDSFMV